MFAVQFVQHNAQSQMFVFEGFLKMHLFQYITLYRHEVGHGAKVSLLPLAIHDTSAATVCAAVDYKCSRCSILGEIFIVSVTIGQATCDMKDP